MGQLFIDLQGTELDAEERELLQHPTVAGVILFTRNYQQRDQLMELVRQVRAAASRPLLISVDHEGGRVQRFREQFSAIPAMGMVAEQARLLKLEANDWAAQLGWLMAAELRACDIDLSFAPVLDLDRGSDVIGSRAFSSDPDEVSELASGFIDGMRVAGMKATGKHFPGHGSVVADTHFHQADDPRPLSEIQMSDMQPFAQLIRQRKLDAVMPAHVVYSSVDANSAGFSPLWLQQVLRQQLSFDGLIFSDDLSMQGASTAGDCLQRAQQALEAGCQLLLACNDRAATISLLDGLPQPVPSSSNQLLVETLLGGSHPASWRELDKRQDYQRIKRQLEGLGHATV
ncbi:beta-N-acetylhexosaminidase [Aliagarivorans taiwanensis]|uniref:beta-N-acetylhexosaminidase n=1 Tax=Aliagarivorans taiwanensis TaxID=561966 RepID=UPI0004055AEE|nr:beta-N-acetylhexosaminidase [Aliagarivorans taiwanensis]